MSYLKNISIFKILGVLAVPVSVVISGLFVWAGSTAAFSGSTTNENNSWTAGTVALTNNHGKALFAAANIIPGYTETHCITVTSTASVPTTLKMYTTAVTSAGTPAGTPSLASSLNVEVLEGSNGTNSDGQGGGCAGFVPATGQSASPTFSGTLAAFANSSSYVEGVGNYNLPAGGSRQYQITVSLPRTSPNSLQGATAGATFVWEAQS